MRLWGKLFLVSFSLIAATLIASHAFFRARLTEQAKARLHEDLIVRMSLVTLQVRRTAQMHAGSPDWDSLADQLGASARARVTLVDRDGRVVGDSELTPEQLITTPAHDQRPEVRAALDSGGGEIERYSETLSRRMNYVAQRLDSGPISVARVALPSTEAEQVADDLDRVLTIGLVLALGLAAMLSSGAAQIATRAARTLTAAARRMAEGDLRHRLRPTGRDELAELARALDGLAENLSSTMSDLTRERDRFASILQSMQEGVLLLEANDEVSLVNPAARELFMLNAAAAGRRLSDICSNAPMLALVAKSAREQCAVSGETELRSPTARSVLVQVVPLARGQRLVVLVDVTDLRRLETVRKEFVSNASHELRTPISAILSAAETLVGHAAADPVSAAPFQQMILRNAERLRNLVDDLLALSRIESAGYSLQRAPTRVADVVQQALDGVRAIADAKQVSLRHLDAESTLLAEADFEALERVLLNLLENAIKYCPAGSEVEVWTEPHGGKLSLIVQDNGPGIPGVHLSRLFERFYRVDAGRSRDIGGTGLGLSIVKHLVEAMGGTIQVASVVGSGARFTVQLGATPAT